MQGRLSSWLVKHGLIHRFLGFDYRGIETLQIKPEDCHSIAVIFYVYGYNYLRSQCAYDVVPSGLLATVYHLTRREDGVDQPEEVLDRANPLTQIVHGRKLSYLGPGGVTDSTASFWIRDIHPSHYGRIYPIDTYKGINVGLIGSLAIHSRIGHWGSLESPFYEISERLTGVQMLYLSPGRDEYYMVAVGNSLAFNQDIQEEQVVPARYRQEFLTIAWEQQRQVFPLSSFEKCIVGTGLERQGALDSRALAIAECEGRVVYTNTDMIILAGRSIIVVGPLLSLHRYGLPHEIAIELFQTFVICGLIIQHLASNIGVAKSKIREKELIVWEILQEFMQGYPVLMNREPTQHTLGIQAFHPVLVEGRAICLHPLVSKGFNADFDGNKMAVHVPLSLEAQVEARLLMFSHMNLLSSAIGDPISVPTQDILIGLYVLTSRNHRADPDDEDLGDDELLNPRRDAEVVTPANRRDRQARFKPERRAMQMPFDDNDDDLDGAGATGSIIPPPLAPGSKFNITSTMIQLLQLKGLFGGLAGDNPNMHLINFISTCKSFDNPGIGQNVIRLRLFPLSLSREATLWLKGLTPDSITNWRSLNSITKPVVDNAAGGSFMDLTFVQASDMLDHMTKQSRAWYTRDSEVASSTTSIGMTVEQR
ncbi:DNA-directed RNA polymerase subunit beta [Capsicum baccatum]|uniref:DNA-directed RNA polymerase n=1 Tax=Capsicum baccatum TaxID=33114 RepID=A0A2G2V6G3_CAPBA|nr:DNA-directed RNA polymerase subunit beta [Capsicum baccatum]